MGNSISSNKYNEYFTEDDKNKAKKEIMKSYDDMLEKIKKKENELIKRKPTLKSNMDTYNNYYLISRDEFERSVNNGFNHNIFDEDSLKYETQKYNKRLTDIYNNFISYIQQYETSMDNDETEMYNNEHFQATQQINRIKARNVLGVFFDY